MSKTDKCGHFRTYADKCGQCQISFSYLCILKKKVKMADNLGPMAWLFLPENEQVQYLQKIAQMRRK